MLKATVGVERHLPPVPESAPRTPPPPLPPIPTHAQRTWIRLFDRSHHVKQPEVNTVLDSTQLSAEVADLPGVGGNHDFVEPLPWPRNLFYITNNVFDASKPFPNSDRTSTYHYECGCDGDRCIADNGTRLSSGCANAGMDLLCDDTNCSVGAHCGNRFTTQFHLDVIATRVGLGVVCSSQIPRGAFIIEYVGELLWAEDATARQDRRFQVALKTKAKWDGSASVFIDAAECGNKSRFINHSCSPNCELYEWEWTNGARLGIFAAKDIPPLQELTFCCRGNNLTLFTCQCGEANCVSNNQ